MAIAPDPLAEATPEDPPTAQGELFVAVGLCSGLPGFSRPALNLAILLDVSGSMAAPFGGFHYGGFAAEPAPAGG